MDSKTEPLIETPSGKGAGDENFPVGSFLLPRALRPHVAVFYAFARAIDDIADNPALAPEDKIARLDAFARAVRGEQHGPGLEKAEAMRASLAQTGITAQHCCDLVSAFQQDAVKLRYASWAELIDYCNRSAAPVGRYLLDLHGESPADYPPSDALCNALQVINHLQDCADDYANLNRVYIPEPYLAAEGLTVAILAARQGGPSFRRVLDHCLADLKPLLIAAHRLPRVLRSRRLALESGAIVSLAQRLTARLAKEDPIATRVALSKPAFAMTAAFGVAETLLRRAA
jgi:hydroxysqualene synthase